MVKPGSGRAEMETTPGYSAGNVVGLHISSASPDRNEKAVPVKNF
jgi:hypothetical protein